MKSPLVVGNWKMHGTQAESVALALEILKGLKGIRGIEAALAPPFTALSAVSTVVQDGALQLAAQNVHWEMEGAFTGEISPKMLSELGCKYVIIGHSERRRLFHERNQIVAKKMVAALESDLNPILCVGETFEERRQGRTTQVLAWQLRAALKGVGKSVIGKIAIAYEPVWAIGTGRNARPEQIVAVHSWVRSFLKRLWGKRKAEGCRILYGGSVRPDNAAALAKTPEVNGLLVGGASLKARDFLSIIRCFVSD